MKKNRKLQLTKETLRQLEDGTMKLAPGGILPDDTNPTYPSYWCTQGFTSCGCPTQLTYC